MFVDVHCHLHFKEFDADRDDVIKRTRQNKVVAVITSGTDHENNIKALELASKYDIVKASLGLYPTDILALSEEEIQKEFDFIVANRSNIIAVGEIGLDYKDTTEKLPQEKQKKYFGQLLEIAEKLKKPVVLHTRKAEADVIEIMQSTTLKDVVFHCFTGNYKLIKKIVNNGWYFSIPPIILRSLHFQGLVNMVPITQLLTETDSPYLAPLPKQRNEPMFVAKTVEKIAEIKNIAQSEVTKNNFSNFQRIFLKR